MTPTTARDTARRLDADDSLAVWRREYAIPTGPDGRPWRYFCGHSLGLMPHAVPAAIEAMTAQWRDHAVDGHFKGPHAWLEFAEQQRPALARLVGAEPAEVVLMNALTVNLHLLLAGFYRPAGRRRQLVIEHGAFPSDRYAVQSQIRWHGLDPDAELIEIAPQQGGTTHGVDGLERYLAGHGDEVALVLWPGVQYLTGEAFDLRRIAERVHAAGALICFDLAHAAGNSPLALSASGIDGAVWCSYKYLNGGPGALAGMFIHQRHHNEKQLHLGGWWGVDVAERFAMRAEFHPAGDARAWQISNPPIMTLAAQSVALDHFAAAGMANLRDKSLSLTGFLEHLIDERLGDRVAIVTPRQPERRGAQLSLRITQPGCAARDVQQALAGHGVIADFRMPDIIRLAPVPLYNTHEDVFDAVEALHAVLTERQ